MPNRPAFPGGHGRCGLRFCLLLLVTFLPLAAAAQTTISEVTVIAGGSWGIQPPAGWTKIEVDLNRNAGGAYIFACYKKGVGAPITGLTVLIGQDAMPPVGWERINVDLNQGAGGNYLWLCTTRDPACATVKDMVVLLGDAATPAGYYKIPVDLNRNAGGDYIYLAYLAQ